MAGKSLPSPPPPWYLYIFSLEKKKLNFFGERGLMPLLGGFMPGASILKTERKMLGLFGDVSLYSPFSGTAAFSPEISIVPFLQRRWSCPVGWAARTRPGMPERRGLRWPQIPSPCGAHREGLACLPPLRSRGCPLLQECRFNVPPPVTPVPLLSHLNILCS